ncbi:thioredoxin domain-containing protein 3 [Sorex fumeus]|uniref:thioredoxin domain-containing protein 3 n=1 Tax=Sorex fumeus TaxID=62283 RepID=UPI0024AD886B|nr:thioredoxin domain-containing protein 3 [Sorex fumeus]
MASRKREIQLQAVVNSQAQWDEMLQQNKGLTVIDVYQAWCGPCKAMQTLFRKLKNELNEDELLHFVVAEADNIVTLQSFKDKCEPVFLFCVNGKIVGKVKGANAPLVSKKILTLVEEERKIVQGEMERPQYNEIIFVDSDEEYNEEGQPEESEELYNIVIIRPDAVMNGKTFEIKDKISRAGFIIEADAKKLLTEEQVRDFYSKMDDQPDFEDFISFMTSTISYILIISQGEVFPEKEPEPSPDMESEDYYAPDALNYSEMRQGKRNSLQEHLERHQLSSFCDVEKNPTKVDKLIDIFFPDFKAKKTVKLEKILVLLRPDLFRERKDDVLNILQEEGFKILMQRQVVLSEDEAQILCKEYEHEAYFEDLIENMISAPSLALALSRNSGLQYWKEIIGPSSVDEAKQYFPGSLCDQFAMESLPINQLYGSSSLEAAEREIQYFFPAEYTLAVIKPHVSIEEREEILNLIKENGFEIIKTKEIIVTEEYVEKMYYSIKSKPFYKDVVEMLSENTSLIMILSKWSAVTEWRRLMGPIDPEEAKLLSPNSIRARYGKSILKNAVHGASSNFDAMETISKIFEDFVIETPK